MKYIYIINRDKQIFEFEYSEERLKRILEEWTRGGILNTGGANYFSCADISKILDEDQYDSYIKQARPKMWIKDGTWYDDGGFVKHEAWKQSKLDSNKKIEEPVREMTEEEIQKISELVKKYKPDFLK